MNTQKMKYKNIKIKSVDNKGWTTIDWVLGNYCNYKCNYCFDDLNTGTSRIPKINDTIKKNIKHLIEQLDLPDKNKLIFSLTGGEPTMYHDFQNLTTMLKNYGKIKIITNGSRTLEWWKNNYHFLDSVSISYHSSQANLMHILNVINFLSDKLILNLHIIIDSNYFEQSKNAALDIRDFLLKNNFNHVGLQLKSLRSTKTYNVNYTDDQLNFIKNFKYTHEYLDTKSLIHPASKITLETGETYVFMNSAVNYLTGSFNGYKCNANRNFVQIDRFGNIGDMSCGKLYTNVSNIYSNDFVNNFNFPKNELICDINNSTCGCLGLLFSSKYLDTNLT